MERRIVTRYRRVKKLTVNYYTDSGHGWFKIDKKLIKAIKFEDKISSYSYVSYDNKNVFLEEDSDAPKVLDALRFEGVQIRVKHHHTNRQSKIRNYRSYYPELIK